MRILLKTISSFLLKYCLENNLYISLYAVLMFQSTIIYLDNDNIQPNLWLFIFLSTFLVYNIDRQDWQITDYLRYKYIALWLLIGMSFSFWALPYQVQSWLFFLGFLALSYALPQSLGFFSRFSLRKIPLFKIFIVVLVWALVSVILPFITLHESFLKYPYWLWERVLFLFTITLPFDIVDYEQDRKQGLITWATYFGIGFTYRFSFFLGIIFILFVLFFEPILLKKIMSLGVGLVSLGVILPIKAETSRTYYKIYVDGTMGLYGILHIIAGFYS